MIIKPLGDIFDTGADVLVNPVNCQGISGKGLAKEFKDRFPDNFASYKEHCKGGELQPGRVWIVIEFLQEREEVVYVANFATKDDWRNPSRIEWIEEGLQDLRRWYDNWYRGQFAAFAIPRLGCGLGGLDWADVRPLILETFKDCDVELYIDD